MAIRYIGHLASKLVHASQRDEIVGASSGGTLAGSQDVQVVFDDAVFGATPEGKQRLMDAIDAIHDSIASAKTWPIDSTS